MALEKFCYRGKPMIVEIVGWKSEKDSLTRDHERDHVITRDIT